jgi:putative addiction module component (TIGR02574 family)
MNTNGIESLNEQLSSEIRRLPISARVKLAEQIWDSVVDDETSFELTDSQKSALDERISAHEQSPDRGKPWEEVKQRLLGE